eukprot:scaffold31599_cov101-Isochrysis_galbana.AAC.1
MAAQGEWKPPVRIPWTLMHQEPVLLSRKKPVNVASVACESAIWEDGNSKRGRHRPTQAEWSGGPN